MSAGLNLAPERKKEEHLDDFLDGSTALTTALIFAVIFVGTVKTTAGCTPVRAWQLLPRMLKWV